ncbi:hypothetical protein WJX72_011695 [[Myrmecia] bisecta]|uniref:Uncharacterized protein n=1 Tax=[Myrmecia] bisecta TaxID=41462 RepID=A0AAW1P3C9_9CHLO
MTKHTSSHEANASIVIVPTTTSYELDKPRRTKTAVPKKKRPSSAGSSQLCGASYATRNFLLTGGGRSIDQQREDQLNYLNRAAIKDLRSANTALANELTRLRTGSSQEMNGMRQELANFAAELKAEQERTVQARERLAEETHAREELELKCHDRIKELQKRLRDEHILRTNAEHEVKSLKGHAAAYKQKLSESQTEASRASQLAAELEAERRTHQEAKARLEAEVQAKRELWEKHSEMEGLVKVLTDRANHLSDALREADGTAANLAGLCHLTAEVAQLHSSLEAERSALAASRSESARMAQQLSEYEGAQALHIAQEAECERLHSDLENARMKIASYQKEVELLEADRKKVADKAKEAKHALKVRDVELDVTREELDKLRQSSEKQIGKLRAEYEEKKKALLGSDEHLQAAKEKLERRGQEVQSLANQLADKAERCELLTRQRDELTAVLAKADTKLQEREEEVHSLRRQLGNASDEVVMLRHRLEQLQAQLDTKERDLCKRESKVKELMESLRVMTERLASSQTSSSNDRSRLEEHVSTLEARLQQANLDVNQMREALDVAERSKHNATTQLAIHKDDIARLRCQLSDEQTRAAKLRAELATIESSHSKELESKSRMVADVVAAMQAEEKAKLEAQQEAQQYRRRAADLEANMSDTVGAKQRAEDSFTSSQAALSSMKKKAHVYRKENRTLLSNYDDWLKSLVSHHGSPSSMPTPLLFHHETS